MNKSDLVAAMASKADVTQAQAGACVDAMMEIISSEVGGGGEVNIPGYVKFSRKDTKERMGRNPRTGEARLIPAGTAVKIAPGSKLKAAGKGA
jgi:DNA-binding protein HU-beta